MTFLVKLVLSLAGIVSFVFGAHGLVVYFTPVESLFDKYPSDLFLQIRMPEAFWNPIEWMTYKGLESWVIPVVFIGIALVLWVAAGKVTLARKAEPA